MLQSFPSTQKSAARRRYLVRLPRPKLRLGRADHVTRSVQRILRDQTSSKRAWTYSVQIACSETLKSRVGSCRPIAALALTSSLTGPADRLLIYLILFISDCINKIAPHPGKPAPQYQEAVKSLSTLAVDHFSLPGDAGFPMNNLYHGPRDRSEAGT